MNRKKSSCENSSLLESSFEIFERTPKTFDSAIDPQRRNNKNFFSESLKKIF